MKQNGFCVKLTASTLLLTFSYSQLLMAADVRQMLLDAKTFFAEEDAQRPHGMAASDLQAAQDLQLAQIDQQQMLEDFQNTTFNLTTPNGDVLKYVGDKLSEVNRPDGTKLAKIVTDAAGNIQNADLKLSDGSVQIFEGGKVIGYQMPDGSQVLYDAAGAVSKVISKAGVESLYTYIKDAAGKVIETIVNNPDYQTKYDANGKIKEATRTTDNQKIYYTNGIIQKIVNADGSETLFNSSVVGGDTVVTPVGGGSDVYTDAQGNKFYFVSGSVSKITLADGSNVDSIAWDASGKIDGATLTEADKSIYIYQSKKLIRSFDSVGVVTNFTYTATSILAAKAGNTWEYLLDGTPVKYTTLTGDVTTYLASGAYKGLKDTETLSTGVKYVYEYQGSGASITVQKREVVASMYNTTTFDGLSVNAQSSNPGFRTTVRFPSDGTIDQAAVITAVYSTTKNLKLNLVSGTGSTYTWNGVTTSLGVTLSKSVNYKVELKWETGRIGIYVYAASAAKPATPTKPIADRAWDPKFKAVGTNVVMTLDGTSSGYYNSVSASREKSYANLSGSPATRLDFIGSAASYKTLYLKATQWPSGSVSRTFEYWFNGTSWAFTQTEKNWSTGAQTVVNGSPLTQSYASAKNYVVELRVESGKMNFYVYEKGFNRPATPASSFTAYSVGTAFETSTVNYLGTGAQYKNLSTPTVQSATATPLTARINTIKNSTIIKPAAPSSANVTDFTSIIYDSTAALKQVLFKDGSQLNFFQGVLTQALDAAGKQTTFNFEQSGLSNIVGSSIVQSNLTSTYSAEGKLSSVKTGELTIHYKTDGSSVDWIEKTDGTELWDLVFDASGALTGASIYAPTGEIRTYAAGKLINLRQADQSQLFYANDKVTQMITPEKLTYNFDYTSASIIQATLAGTAPVDTLTPIKMEYDTNFNLKKVTRQNQEILNYLNTDLIRIDAPSTEPGIAPKVFVYDKDAAGKILSYTVTQGNVVTYYDANNQPTRAVISADATNPNNLDISYQYGKIRQIKKDGAVTFNYTYSFTADGTEQAVVEDVEENTQKTYKNSNLETSLDRATNVLSSYEYTSEKVSKVTVTRFGRLLHTYNYSYSGPDTKVQDEAGVIRTYDANKKLAFLEKNGEKFSYTYSTETVTTQNGPPVTAETLLPNSLYLTSARSVLSWDGSTGWYSYEKAYGKDYLQTHWAGQWVEYSVNMSEAGDLKINLEATDSGALPAGYTNFQLDLSVDGAVKGTMGVPAVGSNAWQAGTATLTGLSQGSHVIRVKFNNFLSSGGQQTDFKFRNISFKQVVTTTSTTTSQKEIVQSALVQKRMTDGTLLHYVGGKVSKIDQADGKVLQNFVEDENGNLAEVTILANAQDAAGVKVSFDRGAVSKITLAGGQELLYSYDKGADGMTINTWVKKGAARLKYNAAGTLDGLRIDGVMTTEEVGEAATHNYQGGVGALSIDGNFDTFQGMTAGCSGCGGSGVTVTSEHSFSFAQAQVIQGIVFRMVVSAYASGRYIREHSASYRVEVLRNGIWEVVPASSFGCGGGDGSCSRDSGIVNLTNLNLDNVTAVRANASGFGNASGGEGSSGGSALIYEIQYTLADLANMTLSTDSSGYSLTGYKGTLKFNTLGAVTQSDADYTPIQQELAGVIQNYAALPYSSADFGALFGILSDSQTIVSQEYSADGALETQTKGDGTTTLFEKNKASVVLDEKGEILIQYAYDAEGNPTRVYLKHARDSLPDEVAQAHQTIEEQRAKALLVLAQQRNLGYQTFKDEADQSILIYEAQRQTIQSEYDRISSINAKGKEARSQKADALAMNKTQMDDNSRDLELIRRQEADAYAALDDQVEALSLQIAADSEAAFTELTLQETNLKKEILRQEISPIVYDYYRRILGRDPDSREYKAWIDRINYESTDTLDEPTVELGPPTSALFWAKSGQALSVESESFMGSAQDSLGRGWAVASGGSDYSGDDYLWVGPNGSQIITSNIAATSPRLDFKAYFDVPGTYYLWVRGTGSDTGADSIHGGLDGAALSSSINIGNFSLTAPSWSNTNISGAVVKITIATAGEHTVNFWMREDGFRFDKFILTQDGAFVPTSVGPVESGRQGAVQTLNLTDALEQEIGSLPELVERQTYVGSIKSAVTDHINDYLSMTQAEKETFAATLGLTAQDLVPLSQTDADAVLDWINTRSLHFGQSAFLALESLLDQKGKVYTRETLAKQAILIDILTGVISPLDDGDLVISVFALNKVAGLYSVSLTGANLAWDDLKAIVPTTATPTSPRVIAHINGNHYVVITGITQDSITYIDPGKGKDKQNEVITLSKAEFLKGWKGNITAESSLINPVVTASAQKPTPTAKLLTKDETQKIRGAFFFFFIPAIIGALSSIGGAIGAVIAGIGSIIGGIGALVGNVLAGVGQILGGVLNGIGYIGNAIFQGISFAASSLWGALGNVGSFLSQNVFGSLAKAGFGNTIFQNAVRVGLNIAVSKGLESLGVNPTISNLASAFVTGGITGGFDAKGLFQSTSFIQGGIKGLALEGSQTLLTKVGLDANLASALSLASGQFVNGILQGNLGGQIVKIGQSLGTNLSMYGIEKLGVSLGVDSRIASLAGIPITSTIGAFGKAGDFTQNIITGIKDGITRGITGVAFEYINQRAGFSPLVGAMIDLGLTGALEGVLEGQGLFKGAFDSYFNATNGLLTFGGQGATEYDRVIYLSKVLDFSRIAKDQGIGNALNSYATSIFSRQSLENIWKAGGIYDLLAHNAEIVTNDEGITVKRLYFDKTDKARSEYIDISLADDQLLGYKEIRLGATIITDCVYEVGPDGRVVAKDEKKRVLFDDGRKEVYIVKDHYLVSIEKIDASGKTVAWIRPSELNHGIEVNADDTIKSGTIHNFKEGWVVEIKNNEISKSIILDSSMLTDAQIKDFVENGTNSSYLASIRMVASYESGNIKIETTPGADISTILEGSRPKVNLISGNGMSNPNPENYPPGYEAIYRELLAQQNISNDTIYLLPMFEGGNVVRDVITWIYDAFTSKTITQEIIAKYDTNINLLSDNDKNQPKTAVLYSGSFNPFMMALGQRHDYNVETVIALGGPSIIGTIIPGVVSNPNLKKIVNIYGANDIIPFAAMNKIFSNAEVVNVKLLGASHFDYFYEPDRGAINDKASRFVENLTSALVSKDSTRVDLILSNSGITYDANLKLYTVDLSDPSFTGHNE